MPVRESRSGSELFIVDNSDTDWKVQRYLRDWCEISKAIDAATAVFEIGGLLALEGGRSTGLASAGVMLAAGARTPCD